MQANYVIENNDMIQFNKEQVIHQRKINEIIQKLNIVDEFVTADCTNAKHINILHSWKKYFDEEDVPYVVTSRTTKQRKERGGKEVLILWKLMPYSFGGKKQ